MFTVPCLISYCFTTSEAKEEEENIRAGVEGEESENKRVKIKTEQVGSHVNVRANDSKAKFSH